MEKVYAQEEDEGSYEYVQLSNANEESSEYEHEHDTEDIPDDPYYDPVNLTKKRGKRRMGEPLFDKAQYLAQQRDLQRQDDANEVQDLMTSQTQEDR